MKGKVTKVIRLVYRNEWSGGIKQLELDSDAIMEGKQDCKFRLVDFFNHMRTTAGGWKTLARPATKRKQIKTTPVKIP